MKNMFFYETDIGKIGMAQNERAITNLFFEQQSIPEKIKIQETELLKEGARQLRAYLSGAVKSFNLPLEPQGTDFMKNIWETLMTIPYGETQSYGEIAKAIGMPKAYRAVGLANNKNPLPIFIPCHRVIGSNGKLIGYIGGVEVKKYLIEMEKRYGNI